MTTPQELKQIVSEGLLSFPVTDFDSQGNFRADTYAERQTGLMGRESLTPYDGMVFLWTGPTMGSFWMKDTRIPLSVAFWDEDGRILSIIDMEPCRADPCPTYGPDAQFVGALEVARGEFERRGVEVGDTVELDPKSP